MKLGKAITLAMKNFLKRKKKMEKKDPKYLDNMTGIIKIKKKVKWGEEIDEFLYGLEK